MTEELKALPPAAPSSPSEQTGLLVTCATIVLLTALGAGGYFMWQELQRIASAPPQSPPEVTQALSELRTQLDRQRSESTQQLAALQEELVTLKQQQAEQVTPDIDASLAPVQEKLDALAAQLEVAAAPAPVVTALEAEAASVTPENAGTSGNALRDYLALRRTVEAGAPYSAQLATLIPQLPDSVQTPIAALQAYAEHGLGVEDEEADAPTAELKPWMHTVNDRLRGLVSIKPSASQIVTPQARAEAMAALDAIEASLMGGE